MTDNTMDTERAGLEDSALRFLQGNDLYSLLMDIQNGIDSPATCSIANSLIIRLDKIRAALNKAVE